MGGKKCYQRWNFSRVEDTFSDDPDKCETDSENNSDSSIIGNKQNKSLRLLLSDNEQTDSDDDTLDLTVYTWVKLHKT